LSESANSLPDFIKREENRALVGPLRASGLVASAKNEADCRAAIRYAQDNDLNICPRGGGYSYGDAILNDQNLLLDTSAMNEVLHFDGGLGIIVAQPGLRLIDVQNLALPHYFILPSVPSEPTITIGGAAGCNVNGKDGFRVGNFGDSVQKLKLMTAAGDVVTASRTENADIFFAAIGGMGLLGVILELTIQLQKIPSPFIHVSRRPADNIDQLLEFLDEVRTDSDHAVVWLDSCAKGEKIGRGVIHSTRWTKRDNPGDLPKQLALSMKRLDSRRAHADFLAPVVGLVVRVMMHFQTASVGLFNKFYFFYSRMRYRFGTADNDESVIRYNFDASFMIPSASAVCGPRGYTIQLTVPRSNAREAIAEMMRVCQRSPCYPAKLIMRLHRNDQHVLSFCEDGFSLNFEFHPKRRQVESMKRHADELIEITIQNGGKVHLAKDHVLTRDQFQRLFPGYKSLLELKARLDPGELFQSDLYRRLIQPTD